MKEEYKNLNTWMEKSECLRNLITPKVASKVSEVIAKTHSLICSVLSTV